MLRDKTVMWLRRTNEKVSLLTVGRSAYSADQRVSVQFQYPNNWRLQIDPVKREDAGLYLCQVSTHPPRVLATNLTVLPPAVRVVDERGHEVHYRYYKTGSAIELTCQVATSFLSVLPTSMPVTLKLPTTSAAAVSNTLATAAAAGNVSQSVDSKPRGATIPIASNAYQNVRKGAHKNVTRLTWTKDGVLVPDDILSVDASSSPTWYISRLSVAHAEPSNSGAYTCAVPNATAVTVHVHVLNGEAQAAVHHDIHNDGADTNVGRYSPLFCVSAVILLSIL